VGQPFGLVARFGMNNACCGLKTPFDEVHHLGDIHLEGFHDMFMHEGSPSLSCADAIPNSLERSHVSPMLSQPSFFPEHSFDVPMIFLNFVILMLIWTMRITCLICLVGMLKLLSP